MADRTMTIRKKRAGTVIRAKTAKTVIVQVETLARDRRFNKYLKSKKRYMVHDARSECRPGDKVTIVECKPLSKFKCWKVAGIVSRAE